MSTIHPPRDYQYCPKKRKNKLVSSHRLTTESGLSEPVRDDGLIYSAVWMMVVFLCAFWFTAGVGVGWLLL